MQALIWKEELIRRGHHVVLVDNWGEYDWKAFDIIHFFGAGSLCELIQLLHKHNKKIVISPIIDSNTPKWLYGLISHWGNEKIRLFSSNYYLRWASPYVASFLTRSRYEYDFIRKSYGVEPDRIHIVPLSFRSDLVKEDMSESKKEPFCLHVSSYSQPRKNCYRLVQAAIRYGFPLVVAGNPGSSSESERIKKLCAGHDNIQLMGFVSDDELAGLYRRAKVFALPSLFEGVGLVALEAAIYGCEIVITQNGGPKEYYDGQAFLVDPKSVDSIGRAVVSAMKGRYQPHLRDYILKSYNLQNCVSALEDEYKRVAGIDG